MYSPAPIEKTSASAAAIPAMRTAPVWCVAPATVLTTARMLVTPSCAPKTTSRISPSRSASRRSSPRCSASQRASLKGRSGVGSITALCRRGERGMRSASPDRCMIETQPTGEERPAETTLAKILVVDDDEPVAHGVCELLRDEGYTARAITDPRRAIEAFGDFQPDLVILDVLMPSVDGISLCLQL